MIKKSLILFSSILLFSCSSEKTKEALEGPVTINWWHSMGGSLGERVQEIVKKYNGSQEAYKVEAVYRGNYTESLNAAIAAYRGKKQPHIVQVFEVGTQTMMTSGAIYPVQQLLKENGVELKWDEYLEPVLSYYQSDKGQLLSLPFNSSTPILYYNNDSLKKAGVQEPPTTWEELYTTTEKLVKSGSDCGLAVSWQSWLLIENFSAIHDLPFASQSNGFSGFDAELRFDNPTVASNIKKLQSLIQTKAFSYQGRRSDPSRNAFTAGQCAMLMDSSSSLASINKLSKFPWSAAPLPYKAGTQPRNSIIGGATLWVFKGHESAEYKGVADFLTYLAGSENQKWWHKNSGYLPISRAAYNELKEEGYYKEFPQQEVAIKQLLRSKTSKNSRGIRLGGFTQIREIINEELEKVWAQERSPEQGLKAAAERGNKILRRFEKTVSN